MNTHNSNMILISISELTSLISECLKAELIKGSEMKTNIVQDVSNCLLSRKEVSEMLKVSYPTLYHWNNNGTLLAQKLGNRVYYQKSQILEKLNSYR